MSGLQSFIDTIVNFLVSLGPLGGVALIVLESIYPFLPLCVFIALNISAFGGVLGIIISYVGTIIGCILSYTLFKKIDSKMFTRFNEKEKVKKMKSKMSNMSISSLAVLTAIPFAPAFLINISAGLSNMKFKKFIIGILIGKVPMILFWSFIGKSLSESLTDYRILIKIGIMLVITYIISKIVNKLFKLEV